MPVFSNSLSHHVKNALLGVDRPSLGLFTPCLGLSTPSNPFSTPCRHVASIYFILATRNTGICGQTDISRTYPNNGAPSCGQFLLYIVPFVKDWE